MLMLKHWEQLLLPNVLEPVLDDRFSANVLLWFDKHGRHTLPWQENPSPYRVWISEVMLQQTQVNTVIAYFQRFVAKFPAIQDLANAPLDDVLGLWSGLGYYSRARNLHKCAQIICNQYHGEWPMDVSLLEQLPGIGRSTAGAIISLSNNHFAPILDGNVKRVLARFFAIDTWTGETKTQKLLWEKATLLTSKDRPKDYNQAMMDLGAMICTRSKPQCSVCPLQKDCQAFQQNKTSEYPKKKIKAAVPSIHKQFLLILTKKNPVNVNNSEQHIFLYKRPPTGIWGGLWSLPELEMDENPTEWATEKGFSCVQSQSLPLRKHVFSHFILYLHPMKIWVESESIDLKNLNPIQEECESVWHDFNQAWPGGLAAPITKLMEEI